MELVAEKRNITGRAVKNMRSQGLVPAVFYGRGMENENLSVERRAFEQVLKDAGESTIVSLNTGGEVRPVIIHEVSRDPLSNEVVHVDFYGVRMDEEVVVMVALEFRGDAPAVKEKGGVFVKSMNEVEVEALPQNLPRSIAVDVSGLADIGQSIYVKDLQTPEGVTLLVDPNTVIATISERMAEEEAPVAEVDVSQIKVEGEEKRETQQKEEEAEKGKEE